MSDDLQAIKMVRDNLQPTIEKHLPTYKEAAQRMGQIHGAVVKYANEISESPAVSHKVGEHIQQLESPVAALHYIRRAIYKNAEVVNYFKTDVMPHYTQITQDIKALQHNIWTGLLGDIVMLANVKTNAAKEREAAYLMLPVTQLRDNIKSRGEVVRSLMEWTTNNLDALNKIESALRLQHNMTMALGDIGDNTGASVGSDGMDLENLDAKRPRFGSSKQNLELGVDEFSDLDDDDLEGNPTGNDEVDNTGKVTPEEELAAEGFVEEKKEEPAADLDDDLVAEDSPAEETEAVQEEAKPEEQILADEQEADLAEATEETSEQVADLDDDLEIAAESTEAEEEPAPNSLEAKLKAKKEQQASEDEVQEDDVATVEETVDEVETVEQPEAEQKQTESATVDLDDVDLDEIDL